MSGYLSRLANRTGLKISSAPHSLATTTPDFFSAPAATATDVVEQTVQVESKPALGPLVPANFSKSGKESFLASRGAAAAARPSTKPIEYPKLSLKQQPNRAFENSAHSNIGTPPASTQSFPARAAEGTVQQVLAWIADDDVITTPIDSTERNPLPSSPLSVHAIAAPVSAETIDRSVSDEIAHLASAPSLASATKFEGAEWWVQIGSIHLTIEAPLERAEPLPPTSQHGRSPPAPPPRRASGTVSSRLRRYHLRSC
jgi:hypothetical protein